MTQSPIPRSSPLAAILAGGLVAGTIDIGAAALINRFSPFFIMKVIAGGLLGKAAFHGDAMTAATGLLLQWGMSWTIAAIFVAAALRLHWMLQRWVISGMAYGVVVYFVMNDIVLPLSAIGHGLPPVAALKFCEDMLAMLLFGLIVAFFAQRFVRPSSQS